MKTLPTMAAVLLAGLTASAVFGGETTHYYDAAGRSMGSARTSGGTTRYYDATNRPVGGHTRYYDASGRSLGSARTSGDTTRYYDAAGRPAGTARGPAGPTAFFAPTPHR